MKNIVTFIVVSFVSLSAFAESHGGVVRSNTEFAAASEFALNEGGNLMRVLSVTKLLSQKCHDGSVFKIKWASADHTGYERPDGNETLVLVKSAYAKDSVELETTVSVLDSSYCPSQILSPSPALEKAKEHQRKAMEAYEKSEELRRQYEAAKKN